MSRSPAATALSRRLAYPGFGQARDQGPRLVGRSGRSNWGREGPLRVVGGVRRTHLALRQFIDLSADRRDRPLRRRPGLQSACSASSSDDPCAGAVVTAGHALSAGPAEPKRSPDHAVRPRSRSTSTGPSAPGSQAVAGLRLQLRRCAPECWCRRAYNPGGTTLRFDIARPDNFEAEKLWDYELFARARLGHGLNASANIFYYDMQNAQRAKGDRSSPAPAGFEVGFADMFNVPKARSYGLEAELDWRRSSRLSSRFALGLLHTQS